MILASYHPLAGSRSIVRLASHGGKYFHVVLTNPPFGKKSSVAYVNEEGGQERDALTILRDDFWASTSSKQVNFVQHVRPILEIHGRAAVVVPDNLPAQTSSRPRSPTTSGRPWSRSRRSRGI